LPLVKGNAHYSLFTIYYLLFTIFPQITYNAAMKLLLPIVRRMWKLFFPYGMVLLLLSCSNTATPLAMQASVGLLTPTPVPQATFVPRRTTPVPAKATPTALPQASATPNPTPASVPTYGYRVRNTYNHDRNAFTQGLIYADGQLYEGTGLQGASSLRRVKLETGEVLQSKSLEAQYFGEGIALFGDKIYQLTWRNGVGFIYDKTSFNQLGSWNYPPAGRTLPVEGWGLTTDGQQLIMSDGTANLYFLDPQTLAITSEITVRDQSGPLQRLNELEYIDGAVFANIWQTDLLAKIDPQTGNVLAYIDLSGLLTPSERQGSDVLNGIAYDPLGKRLFVTGKFWPTLFEIELVPPSTGYRVTMPLLEVG
jgi:glutaminyl-peptide cyclotransferase